VRARIPQGARSEFYAGVGAIGLSVLPSVGHITMNEVSPHSLQGLEIGQSRSSMPRTKQDIAVVPGEAGARRLALRKAQVVIADPPRKGLDPALAVHLREQPARAFHLHKLRTRLAVPRCSAADLGRQHAPRRNSRPSILLPYTEHVETVACFERPCSKWGR
jgi:hypothetical protein